METELAACHLPMRGAKDAQEDAQKDAQRGRKSN